MGDLGESSGATRANVPSPGPSVWARSWKWLFTLVVPGVFVAWLSGFGEWVQAKLSDEPTVSYSATFPRGQCETFVVPRMGDDIGAAPEPVDLVEWAVSRDGAQGATSDTSGAGFGQVLVTLTGYEARPVTVTGIEFEVVERADPLVGTVVANECGGSTEARFAEVDLDESPPAIVESSADAVILSAEMETTPLRFPYTITGSETESLLIIARTQQYVEWRARILWSNGESDGVLVVDNDGEPFRVTAPVENNTYLVPAGGGEWLRF